MLLDLSALRTESADVPGAWDQLVRKTPGGFIVSGERVAAREVLLADTGAGVVVADRADELLTHLLDRGVRPPLSRFGISSLLHSGLVPPPFSEFDGILSLTIGDEVHVTWPGERVQLDAKWDYPWFAAKSRNDGVPSEERLLELLTAATTRDVAAAGGSGFLMLSSGKDSAAVALALAEAGLTDVPCVTYSSGADDPEPAVAADICRRLGLEHHVVEMPNDPLQIAERLTQFFSVSPLPGADLAQIPYVMATAAVRSPTGVVLDGGGNDSYMGFPVTGRWAWKARLRVRGRRLRGFVQRHTSVDSPLNYLARSRLGTGVSGRMMRHHESRTFMSDSVNTQDFWEELSHKTAHLNLFDAYAILERYITPPSSMKKHFLAARAIDHEPSAPWCDGAVADYYFNLPVEHRYDKKRGISKVMLRRMLHRYLDYDANGVGKRYFAFDGARFITNNHDFVRSEIDACRLWDRTKLDLVHSWMDEIEGRPLLYHPILTVFMVSGWHNHSRFLTTVETSSRELAGD